jgi:hypothetical protein
MCSSVLRGGRPECAGPAGLFTGGVEQVTFGATLRNEDWSAAVECPAPRALESPSAGIRKGWTPPFPVGAEEAESDRNGLISQLLAGCDSQTDGSEQRNG